MSAEHKRPLYAFVMVALLCAVFLGHAIRSDALGGVLRALPVAPAMVSEPPLPGSPAGQQATPSAAEDSGTITAGPTSASTVRTAVRTVGTDRVDSDRRSDRGNRGGDTSAPAPGPVPAPAPGPAPVPAPGPVPAPAPGPVPVPGPVPAPAPAPAPAPGPGKPKPRPVPPVPVPVPPTPESPADDRGASDELGALGAPAAEHSRATRARVRGSVERAAERATSARGSQDTSPRSGSTVPPASPSPAAPAGLPVGPASPVGPSVPAHPVPSSGAAGPAPTVPVDVDHHGEAHGHGHGHP